VFTLELSELYVSTLEPWALYPVQSSGRKQAWIAGREIEVPLSPAARLALAQPAAALRAGLLPIACCKPDEARAVLRAALIAAGSAHGTSAVDDQRVVKLVEQLQRRSNRTLRRELEEAVRALPEPQQAVASSAEAARSLGLRAGAIACADLAGALAQLVGSERSMERVLASKPALELLKFWASPHCASLLQTVGMCP
jgi:hypothetical protein